MGPDVLLDFVFMKKVKYKIIVYFASTRLLS